MQELKRKVKGALLGIAYGDSFGMPTEMWTPEQIRERLGNDIEAACAERKEQQIQNLKDAGVWNGD